MSEETHEEFEPTRTSVDRPVRPEGDAAIPETIGRYRILGKLGEGGMGVVFEAEQPEPRRRVALKVVRGGDFVDEARVRMFQREVDTLARLKHPEIGAIYESGRTEGGRHYFAMELVRGATLDRYLAGRGNASSATEIAFRLGIFRKIADAVHYAHQRGVIHRDLKPSNIIVADDEGDVESTTTTGTLAGMGLPQVKILDFGLARITEGDVNMTRTTEVGMIKGTLPYMSPEQARGNPDEIDVRTDVYALGVILYEMLSGKRPYDVSKASIVEAVRVICEQSPRSLRQSLSGARRLDPDVETIVGKALAKDVDRRYESAAALSADVARYLTSQPILARPPSTTYQLRKFAARNRALVGGVLGVIVALVAGVVGTSWQAVVATRQKARAETETAKARQVAAFSKSILAGVGPEVALGRDTELMLEVLNRASERIDEDGLADQPEVEAEIRRTVGDVYAELGEHDLARPQLERSLALARSLDDPANEQTFMTLGSLSVLTALEGLFAESEALDREQLELGAALYPEDHLEMGIALNNLGMSLWAQGKYDEAEPILVRAVEIKEAYAETDPVDYLDTRENLGKVYRSTGRYQEALAQAEEVWALAVERLPELHPSRLIYLSSLAQGYGDLGRYTESIETFERTIELSNQVHGEDHQETLKFANNLVTQLVAVRRLEEAEQLARELLATRTETLGREHPGTLVSMNVLVNVLLHQGRFSEAAKIAEEALEGSRQVLGPEHPDTLTVAHNLGAAHRLAGDFERAATVFRENTEAMRRHFGGDHPNVVAGLRELAQALSRTGKLDGAVDTANEAVAMNRRLLGEDHPDVDNTLYDAAMFLYRRGDADAADAMYRGVLADRTESFGETHGAVARAHESYGRLLMREAGRPDEAIEWLEKALAIRRELHEEEHDSVRFVLYDLSVLFAAADRHEDDAALHRTYIERLRPRMPDTSDKLAWALPRLAGILADAGRPDEALPLVLECLEILESHHPDSSRRIGDAYSDRGRLLTMLGRFDEAEPILLDAYRRLKEAGAVRRAATALERIVGLYDAWGKPAESARWKKERAAG